jgi:hypothetical protein
MRNIYVIASIIIHLFTYLSNYQRIFMLVLALVTKFGDFVVSSCVHKAVIIIHKVVSQSLVRGNISYSIESTPFYLYFIGKTNCLLS